MRAFPYKYMTLNSSLLCVDETYQRKIKQNQINRANKTFNPNLVNVVKVSFRDGKYWIFNGQHTVALLVARNGGNPVQVECKVYEGMTQLDEKELFKLQDGVCSNPTASEIVRGDYKLGEPYAVQMVNAIESIGLTLSFDNASGRNRIVCVSAVLKAFRQLPIDKFILALDILRRSWGGVSESFDNRLISGMAKFVKTYDEFDKNSFIQKLHKEDPCQIISKTKAWGGGSTTTARQFLSIYNNNRKEKGGHRLPDKL